MKPLELNINNPEKHLKGVSDVNSRFTPDDKKKIKEAADKFETMLNAMMLKSMSSTTEGLFGSSEYGGDVFDVIFQQNMAEQMTNSKSPGVSEMIFKQMTGEEWDGSTNIKKMKFPDLEVPHGEFPVVKPTESSMQRLHKYEGIIQKTSEQFGISPNVIKSVILTESAGKENAKSHADAKGLMQLIDSTAKEMGVNNVWDPQENILGGTRYLTTMLHRYKGDLKLALAAYNAGPHNVDKHEGIPPFKETQNYVTRVMGYMNYLERRDSSMGQRNFS